MGGVEVWSLRHLKSYRYPLPANKSQQSVKGPTYPAPCQRTKCTWPPPWFACKMFQNPLKSVLGTLYENMSRKKTRPRWLTSTSPPDRPSKISAPPPVYRWINALPLKTSHPQPLSHVSSLNHKLPEKLRAAHKIRYTWGCTRRTGLYDLNNEDDKILNILKLS